MVCVCVGGFAAVVGVGRWCDRLLLLREGGYIDVIVGGVSWNGGKWQRQQAMPHQCRLLV